MQFELLEEQKLIRDMAADFAREHGVSERVRKALESELGYDAAIWQAMGRELGLAGLLVDDANGGQGLGAVELALVFEALGRHLVPSPLLASGVLAATALAAVGEADWLRKVASGEVRAALVHLQDGVDAFSLSIHYADLALVFDGQALYAIPADHPGVFPGLQVHKHTMMDLTRPLSKVIAAQHNWQGFQVAAADEAAAAYHKAMDMGRIAIAAEAAGAAQETLARTVEYINEREQFGRAVGSFQAVKHQAADMMIRVEAAISAVYFAACAISERIESRAQMAALAKVEASEALSFCAARMIQLHGGIGFTWEHDAHLYFKRARATSTLFGSNAVLDEKIAHNLGLGSGFGETL